MANTPDGGHALKLSSEQLLEWVSDACVVLNRDWRIVYVNRRATALIERPATELVGRSLWDEFPAARSAAFRDAAETASARGVPRNLEEYSPQLDRWFDIRFHPSPDGLLILFVDVTEKKLSERRLREREARLRLLVEQVPAVLWNTDRDLRLISIDGAPEQLNIVDRERLIGLSIEGALQTGATTPEEARVLLESHRRALDGEWTRYSAEFAGRRYHSLVAPLHEEGGIIGVTGVAIDMTDQLTTQAQLRASEERFRAVVERSADLISIVDENARLLYVSPSHERALGYSIDELKRMNIWDILHPDDIEPARQQFAADVKGEGVVAARTPIRAKAADGRWRSFSAVFADLRGNPAVRGILANSRDVTEQLALEIQLRQAQKMEALGQLAGGVAHDFNNILTAITGYAKLLHDELPEGQGRADLEEILKASARAANITKQLLAFGRRQALETTLLDMVSLVRETSGMLRALLPASIRLRLDLPADDEAIIVRADRGHLEQIIMNLAINARDAMSAGGELTIGVRTAVASQNVRRAELEVADTGEGIPPEVRDHLFEPFFTTKPAGRGTGLGLATVYGIVRQYNGAIEIKSTPGAGTAVFVHLPLASPDRTTDAAEVIRDARQKARILLVEDEEQVRLVATRLLRRAGHDVLAAGDGAAALEILREAEVDLVLTDAAMPGMTGQQLAHEIRQRFPRLPIILMSGYAERSRTGSARTRTIAAFVQKPFEADHLLKTVDRILSNRSTSP